jgi:beta-exotoxin I transport system permease protein
MTSRTLVLASHSLRRIRPIVVAMAIVLAGFQFLLTQVAVYLMRTQAFGMLSALVPDFVRSLAGPSMLAFMSFGGVVALGYFHPIVLASLVGLAIAIATEPAAEVETRFADLTLARPLARHQVITRTVIVLAAAVGGLLLVMAAATWIGIACCTPPDADRPPASLIRSLATTLGAVVLCWGGVALAVASAARRRATAAGITAVVTLASYLLDYLGRVWDPARFASRFSPFHYFEPMSLLAGAALSASDVAVLLAIGAGGTIASYILFSKRDV